SPPPATLFPYTTLFRSVDLADALLVGRPILWVAGAFDRLTRAETGTAGQQKHQAGDEQISHQHGSGFLRAGETLQGVTQDLAVRSEEHTSELQSREKLV